MKNKFKILVLSFILLTSCSKEKNKLTESNIRKNQYGNHIIVEAKIDSYRNLNDVEKESEIKVKQNPSIIQKDKGNVNGFYTISKFKIQEVIKGDFKAGDIIDIFESAGIDEETGKIYHILNYELMETNTEYLLFLRRSETDSWYMISGLKYGKISLSGKKGELRLKLEKANEYLEEFETEDRIRNEAIKKYIKK